ncbi:unnamed protein product [Hymenolepis diminuta]|uniref:Uncharacterized protein n=1 Tax=Hymenolepis diminuta TaxID=6216 RepID=A0A564YC50_HYMDI|nr:unnamed protein product [Hymenolepis diminuta]
MVHQDQVTKCLGQCNHIGAKPKLIFRPKCDQHWWMINASNLRSSVLLSPFLTPRKEHQRWLHKMHLAAPTLGVSYLILTDSYSRWPLVVHIKCVSTGTIISSLRRTFGTHGTSKVIVCGTITQFSIVQLEDFGGGMNASLLNSSPNLKGLNEELVDNLRYHTMLHVGVQMMVRHHKRLRSLYAALTFKPKTNPRKCWIKMGDFYARGIK